MGKVCNSMYFSKEDIKNNLHTEFLNVLFKLSLNSDSGVIHIHTYTELDGLIVEWCQHNEEFDDRSTNIFRYINYDEVVMLEKIFPDNHYEYCFSEEEYKERLEDWLKEHPTYKQNQYGHWYDEREYDELKESLKKEKTDNE